MLLHWSRDVRVKVEVGHVGNLESFKTRRNRKTLTGRNEELGRPSPIAPVAPGFRRSNGASKRGRLGCRGKSGG